MHSIFLCIGECQGFLKNFEMTLRVYAAAIFLLRFQFIIHVSLIFCSFKAPIEMYHTAILLDLVDWFLLVPG